MSLIVQGYMTRQPVPLELEIRMADAAGDGIPAPAYPPAGAMAPAPTADAPIWKDGGANSDAASEDIGGASPVSVTGYPPPAVLLGPPPALRARGLPMKDALRDDYEWDDPDYGFPMDRLLPLGVNIEGQEHGRVDGFDLVADYDPDADFDARADVNDPGYDPAEDAEDDPEAPSLSEDDSEVMSPIFSLQNDAHEEEYLFWTAPPPPPAGAQPDPFAGRIRGPIVPAVGAARMRNGAPWVHDGSVPLPGAGADGMLRLYHYPSRYHYPFRNNSPLQISSPFKCSSLYPPPRPPKPPKPSPSIYKFIHIAHRYILIPVIK
ncbi:hypothetical protein DFP73DRAFT_237211 [Morchella snyderi]|nr:hypothetical protein DFP73DRAFT_237211 [Morchella snyderi]